MRIQCQQGGGAHCLSCNIGDWDVMLLHMGQNTSVRAGFSTCSEMPAAETGPSGEPPQGGPSVNTHLPLDAHGMSMMPQRESCSGPSDCLWS